MSFVMFAGCKYFGMFIGERRTVNTEHEIIDENAIKVKRINDNLIVAGAGCEGIAKLIFEYLSKKEKLTFDKAIEVLNQNYSLIYNRFLKLTNSKDNPNDPFYSNLGILSLYNGKIAFADIMIKNEYIRITPHYYETDNDISFCYLAKGLGGLPNYFSNEFYKNPVFTIQNIKSVFYKTLKDNIQNDYTINDRFILEYIIRGDLLC